MEQGLVRPNTALDEILANLGGLLPEWHSEQTGHDTGLSSRTKRHVHSRLEVAISAHRRRCSYPGSHHCSTGMPSLITVIAARYPRKSVCLHVVKIGKG